MGPWKCLKCKLIFTDLDEMREHWKNTGWYESNPDPEITSGGTTWFHVIVDKNDDDVMFGKRVFNDWSIGLKNK